MDTQFQIYSVWKRIVPNQLFSTVADSRTTLELAGMKVGDWAKLSLEGFVLESFTHEVDVVRVTPRTLGFDEKVPRIAVLRKGFTLGLEPLSVTAILLLRYQYTDQERGEILEIAQTPIEWKKDSRQSSGTQYGRQPTALVLMNSDNVLVVDGRYFSPSYLLDVNAPLVFVQPRLD